MTKTQITKLKQIAIISIFINQFSVTRSTMKDSKALVESKPDVTFRGRRTHFWVIVPEIDPNTFDPRNYEDIRDAVIKRGKRFQHAEDMNQFRSCKEHAEINDELFYRYEHASIPRPIKMRKEELEVAKTNCSVVLVQRSTEIRARSLHHHPEKRTCNGLQNYCKMGSCIRRNKIAVLPADVVDHRNFVKQTDGFKTDLETKFGNLIGEWRMTGHWTHVETLDIKDRKDHWLRILKEPTGDQKNQLVRVEDYHSRQADFKKKYMITKRSALYEVTDRMGFKDKCKCTAGFSGPRCNVKDETTESPTTEEATTTMEPTTSGAATTTEITTVEITTENGDVTVEGSGDSKETTNPEKSDNLKPTHPTTIFWWLIFSLGVVCICLFGIYTFLKNRKIRNKAPSWNELELNEELNEQIQTIRN